VTVVAIVAVLGALAAPSFTNLIRSQRIKTATNDLVSSLVFARSEAVKRNADVTVSQVGSSWSEGWNITYDDGGTKTARSQSALNSMTVTTTVTSVVFSGGGRADTTALFMVDSNPVTTGVDARCVEVRPDGLPRVWVQRGSAHDCSDD
jgi:type IV fimbrial biogenesis protein FimT